MWRHFIVGIIFLALPTSGSDPKNEYKGSFGSDPDSCAWATEALALRDLSSVHAFAQKPGAVLSLDGVLVALIPDGSLVKLTGGGDWEEHLEPDQFISPAEFVEWLKNHPSLPSDDVIASYLAFVNRRIASDHSEKSSDWQKAFTALERFLRKRKDIRAIVVEDILSALHQKALTLRESIISFQMRMPDVAIHMPSDGPWPSGTIVTAKTITRYVEINFHFDLHLPHQETIQINLQQIRESGEPAWIQPMKVPSGRINRTVQDHLLLRVILPWLYDRGVHKVAIVAQTNNARRFFSGLGFEQVGPGFASQLATQLVSYHVEFGSKIHRQVSGPRLMTEKLRSVWPETAAKPLRIIRDGEAINSPLPLISIQDGDILQFGNPSPVESRMRPKRSLSRSSRTSA